MISDQFFFFPFLSVVVRVQAAATPRGGQALGEARKRETAAYGPIWAAVACAMAANEATSDGAANFPFWPDENVPSLRGVMKDELVERALPGAKALERMDEQQVAHDGKPRALAALSCAWQDEKVRALQSAKGSALPSELFLLERRYGLAQRYETELLSALAQQNAGKLERSLCAVRSP